MDNILPHEKMLRRIISNTKRVVTFCVDNRKCVVTPANGNEISIGIFDKSSREKKTFSCSLDSAAENIPLFLTGAIDANGFFWRSRIVPFGNSEDTNQL